MQILEVEDRCAGKAQNLERIELRAVLKCAPHHAENYAVSLFLSIPS